MNPAVHLTGIAPQFLVDDLDRAIAYYRDEPAFELAFKHESFHLAVTGEGFGISLNSTPKLGAKRAPRKTRRLELLPMWEGIGRFALMLFVLVCSVVVACPSLWAQDSGRWEWPMYGNDPGGMRYSPLGEINRENVAKLKVAWIFHTGDVSEGGNGRKRSGFETTPILVDGTLYLTTPFNRVIALDPETGKQRWAYDPKIDLDGDYGDGLVNRGVATWLDTTRDKGQPCRRRSFESTQDARLVAIDGLSGAPCMDFGQVGQVSLRDVKQYDRGWYHMTSPPVIMDDLVIVGRY